MLLLLLHYSRFIEHFRFMDIECHIHTNEETSTLFTSLAASATAQLMLWPKGCAASSTFIKSFFAFLFGTVIFLSISNVRIHAKEREIGR